MKVYFKEGLLLFRHSNTLKFSILNCSNYEHEALLGLEELSLVVNEYRMSQEIMKSTLTKKGIFQRDMLFHREASEVEKDLWIYLGESLYEYDGDGIRISSDTMVSFHSVSVDGQEIRKAKFYKSSGSEYFMDMEFALELFRTKK